MSKLITREYEAEQILDILIDKWALTSKSKFLNCCAGVGGDSLVFLRTLKHIDLIEIDAFNVFCLKHNLKVTNLQKRATVV